MFDEPKHPLLIVWEKNTGTISAFAATAVVVVLGYFAWVGVTNSYNGSAAHDKLLNDTATKLCANYRDYTYGGGYVMENQYENSDNTYYAVCAKYKTFQKDGVKIIEDTEYINFTVPR